MANKGSGGAGTGIQYFSVFGGNFVKKLKDGTEDDLKNRKDVVKYTKKNGVPVFYETWSDIDGQLESVEIELQTEKSFSDTAIFKVRNEEGTIDQFSIGVMSGRFTDLIGRLANADINKKLEFRPWQMDKENKPGATISGIALKCDGEKVPKKYTKEFVTSSNMPEWEKIDDGEGGFKWSSFKQVKWIISEFHKQCEESLVPFILPDKYAPEGYTPMAPSDEASAPDTQSSKNNSAGSVSDAEILEGAEDDDLPF